MVIEHYNAYKMHEELPFSIVGTMHNHSEGTVFLMRENLLYKMDVAPTFFSHAT